MSLKGWWTRSGALGFCGAVVREKTHAIVGVVGGLDVGVSAWCAFCLLSCAEILCAIRDRRSGVSSCLPVRTSMATRIALVGKTRDDVQRWGVY